MDLIRLFVYIYTELLKIINYGKRTRKKYQKQSFAYQIAKTKKHETSRREKRKSLAVESSSRQNESEKE
jgi:hypothetical protein